MRLSESSRALIRDTVKEVFGPDAMTSVFGSRTDQQARGGDIDLLVESQFPIENREQKILQLTSRLQLRLGDQPIDVLVIDPLSPRSAIHEQARRTGVPI